MKTRYYFAPAAIEEYRRSTLRPTLRPIAPWLIVGAVGLVSLLMLIWSMP